MLVVGLLLVVATAAWPSKGLAQEEGSPEDVHPSGIVKVITIAVTQIAPERVVSLETFPRMIEIARGETVLWVNAVPQTLARIVFDDMIPSGAACGSPSRPEATSGGRYSSAPIGPGTASNLCFDNPGTYTYRVVISTAAGGALLTGVVVVR